MKLLERAVASGHSLAHLQRALGLSETTLYAAKNRGSLSPAVAGSLAEFLGENVDQWIVIAALEGEKDSACKARMLKRYKRLERAMGIEPTS